MHKYSLNCNSSNAKNMFVKYFLMNLRHKLRANWNERTLSGIHVYIHVYTYTCTLNIYVFGSITWLEMLHIRASIHVHAFTHVHIKIWLSSSITLIRISIFISMYIYYLSQYISNIYTYIYTYITRHNSFYRLCIKLILQHMAFMVNNE